MSVGASRGVVVSNKPLSARAGADVLRRGGNAVDAAVAATLVECIVEPERVGIGGYGGAMAIYLARERKVVCIDFDSVAPLAASPGMFKVDPEASEWQIESGNPPVVGGANSLGALAVGVPGVIAGLAHALKRYGTMPWSEVSKAAIGLAKHGFPVSAKHAKLLQRQSEISDAVSRHAMFGERGVPAEGKLFTQPDLAKLLARLGHDGPDAFYGPEIAGRIVKQLREHGGILEVEDFSRYRPTESEGTRIRCGENELCTPGLPAGGLTSLEIVKAVHRVGFNRKQRDCGEYYHALIEASKPAWLDRLARLGDPRFVHDPTAELLSDAHIDEIASRARAEGSVQPLRGGPSTDTETTYLAAADGHGNFVSLNATHGGGFGSRVVIEGLGLVLGHGMSRFNPTPGRANSIAPGKRMLHNMSPMILLAGGKAIAAFGLPGGRRIVNVAAQMALSFIEFGLSPAEAIAAPRIHTEGREPVAVDEHMPPELAYYLTSRGHEFFEPVKEIGGAAGAIAVDRKTGGLAAASQYGEECVARA